MSNVVQISHLPLNCESSYIFTELCLRKDEIEDVYTRPGGSTCAFIVFKTHEIGNEFANDNDGRHFGRTGQKMITHLRDEVHTDIPEGFTNRLSDFLHARDNQILSRTVEITGFPKRHTSSNLNQLLGPVCEEYSEYNDEVDYYRKDANENDDYRGIAVIHSRSAQPGVGLVQLETPSMAIEIVLRFASTYWKNATLNAQCVPDEEMEGLLVKEKDVMLFVAGLKTGATSTDIRDIFKDFPIQDVNMPPGGKTFCFVFFRQPDANAVLAQFGNGFQWRGRTIRVSISDRDKKKKTAFGAVGAPPVALPPDMTETKLNNLP